MRLKDLLDSIDWVLLAAAVFLILLGLAMLLSASSDSTGLSGLFWRQALAAGLGLIIMAAVIKLPYHIWSRYALGLYIAGLGGLIAVIVVGEVIRGTVSRLEIFGFQIQPSELMKTALVIVLAWFFARNKFFGWRQVFISGILASIPIVIILREPDLGMASLLVALWGSVIVFLGLSWQKIFILGLLGALLAGGAWHWLLLDYQKQRILTFMNPAQDPLESGYNVNQSMIALGSGKITGRGLGHGPQSQLQFLPEQHTDFIFASIGEELGLVGIIVLLSLYAVMLWRILLIAQNTTDVFGRLISVGVFCLMAVSLIVSAGMNMGLLPVTGIPLPLVSYGGSNLVVTLLLLGLVESVRVHSRFKQRLPLEISGII